MPGRRRASKLKMPEHQIRMLAAKTEHWESCHVSARYIPMAAGALRCSRCGETVVQVWVEELLGNG